MHPYESFKDRWFGVPQQKYMVLEVFKQHNEEVSQLTGKDYSPTTLKRYTTSLGHTRSFINWKYKVPDIEISKLNYEFISSYEFWFKSVRNCNHNTTMKYLKNFKKIIFICLKNGWLNRDPFIGFKISMHQVDRPFLTEHELERMKSKIFPAKRMNYVKDIFLFSCYTGLAYVDVEKLKRSEIGVGVDGEKWIFTKRQKTDSPSRIPLLPFAKS
ncbi:MAG: site-specific integrase [Chitinophagaceae bacterium]